MVVRSVSRTSEIGKSDLPDRAGAAALCLEQDARSIDTYLDLIKNAPFGVYLIDSDFRLAQVSVGCAKVFKGIDPLLGRDFAEVLRTIWTEEFAEAAIGLFRHTLATGEPYHSPDTTEQRGNIRVVESYDWQIERVTMPDGRYGVVCYFYDTTDKVHAEQDANFLANLSERCRITTNADALLSEVIREVAVYLGVDRCFVTEVSIADDQWTLRDDYYREGSSSLVGKHRLSDIPPEIFSGLGRGIVQTVSDTTLDPRTADHHQSTYEPAGIRSFIKVPLVRERSWIAHLAVTCETPREWLPREISFLEAVAERIWNAVERDRAQEDLLIFQQRFDLVKDSVEVGFWFCDLPFDKLIWDPRVKEHFWLPPDAEVTIDTFYEQIHPEDRQPTRDAIDSSIVRKGKYDTEYRTVSPQNEIKLIRAIGRTFCDERGDPIRFDGVTLDITALRRAENALRERELLQSSVQYQEAERQRIARDLHDQFGQELTALRLTLGDLHRAAAERPELCDTIEKAQRNALQLDRDVSSLAFQLRASHLKEKGLTHALEDLVAEWSRNYCIEADFHAVKTLDAALPPEIETHIYRIAQESLNNTTKYAKATNLNVLLEINEAFVRLIVEDDGIGFDPAETSASIGRASGHGLGLIGMKERAELLNGNLEIESATGKGTTILVTVPLKPAEQKAVV